MPDFRKLSKDEIAQLSHRQSNLDALGDYIDYLKTLKIDDWGSIELAPGESQRVVKRRTSTAANSLGRKIQWRAKRGNEQKLVFTIKSVK